MCRKVYTLLQTHCMHVQEGKTTIISSKQAHAGRSAHQHELHSRHVQDRKSYSLRNPKLIQHAAPLCCPPTHSCDGQHGPPAGSTHQTS